jgi:hypothetical protein
MTTFPNTPQAYPFIRTPAFVVDVVNYENQKEQRLLRTPTPRYRYVANWPAITPDEKRLVLDFFVARQGNFEAFDYPDPDPASATYGQALRVRFAEAAHNFDYFKHRLWAFNRVELIDAE